MIGDRDDQKTYTSESGYQAARQKGTKSRIKKMNRTTEKIFTTNQIISAYIKPLLNYFHYLTPSGDIPKPTHFAPSYIVRTLTMVYHIHLVFDSYSSCSDNRLGVRSNIPISKYRNFRPDTKI